MLEKHGGCLYVPVVVSREPKIVRTNPDSKFFAPRRKVRQGTTAGRRQLAAKRIAQNVRNY